jgi:hypothetical protein
MQQRTWRSRAAALTGIAALVTTALVPLMSTGAGANLAALGAVNAATGFPLWYQDAAGTRLAECNDAPCPVPRPDLTQPASMPNNLGDENFYFAADTDVTLGNGGTVLLVEALEGAFLPDFNDGNQVVFQRIRIRGKNIFSPGIAYTFTYPFGSRTITADATGTINDTVDTGCLTPPCASNFAAALQGPIDRFPTWDPAVRPAAPSGFIGDYAVLHTITGSPTGNNFFRIDGPNVGGLGVNSVQTNVFNVAGKLAFPVTVAPGALSFPAQGLGTISATHDVTFTNGGSTNVTVSGVSITGANAADFRIVSNGCTATVSPGRTCTISVAFAPGAAGGRSATLSIADDAVGSPRLVSLAGSGVQSLALSPTSLSFGGQLVNSTSAPRPVTISNASSAPVNFSSFTMSGANAADFVIAANSCPATLAAGSSCRLDLTFTPVAGGNRTATLGIIDDAPGAPHAVDLNGVGTAPNATISVSPASLVFPDAQRNTTGASRTVTVTNSGQASSVLRITGVTVSGARAREFVISGNGCAGATLAPGGQCVVTVTFTPQGTGTRTATLNIATDAGPATVSLSGNGTNQAPAQNPPPPGGNPPPPPPPKNGGKGKG